MTLANSDGTWEVIFADENGANSNVTLRKVISEIDVGETKEYTLLLNWEQAGENMGEKTNIVKLVETANVPGFVDNNASDNESKSNSNNNCRNRWCYNRHNRLIYDSSCLNRTWWNIKT